MALSAGRVGVNPKEVDKLGRLKGGGNNLKFVDVEQLVNLVGVRRTATASSKSGGYTFLVGASDLQVYGFRVFVRDTSVKLYISKSNSEHLVSKTVTGLTANAWNTVELDEPVKLNKNTSYTIWFTESTGLSQETNVIPHSIFGVITSMVYADNEDTYPSGVAATVYCYSIDLITKLISGGEISNT